MSFITAFQWRILHLLNFTLEGFYTLNNICMAVMYMNGLEFNIHMYNTYQACCLGEKTIYSAKKPASRHFLLKHL